MKKVFLLAVATAILMLTSCTRDKEDKATTVNVNCCNGANSVSVDSNKEQTTPGEQILSGDTVIFTPTKIGVSKKTTSFVAKKVSQNESFTITYSVGAQIDKKTGYDVLISNTGYSPEIGKAVQQPEIAKLFHLYNELLNPNSKLFSIYIVKGEIVKIRKKRQWLGQEYVPAEILWQKE